MDPVYTPRLDALSRMQSRPLGTNTALYRDQSALDVGRDYRRQQSDYGLARRLLRRDALRGDSRAAVSMIGLQDKAQVDGVSYGGIQSREANQAAVAGRLAQRQQGVQDMNLAAGRARGVLAGQPAPAPVDTEGKIGVATPTLPRPESFEDIAQRKSLESTRAGAFGTGAQERLMLPPKSRLTNPVNNWWDKPIA